MAEENNFNPETPPDVIHNHVAHVLTFPVHDRVKTNENGIEEAASHPNLAPHTATAIFNEFSAKPKEVDTDVTSKLLGNPKVPINLAEQFITTHHEDPDMKGMVENAAKVPGVNSQLLETITDKSIKDPNVSHKEIAKIHNAKPEFYLKLLREKKPYTHFEGTPSTDPEHQAAHLESKKIDAIAPEGLAKNPNHTPETLNQSVDFFTNPASDRMMSEQYGSDVSDSRFKDSADDLIDSQPGLTTEHLNKLHQAFQGEGDYKEREIRASIARHHNTDPALLASIAQRGETNYQQRDETNAAISNPNLPTETRKALIANVEPNKWASIGPLLDNPSTTPEEVQELYAKTGNKSALHNEKMPPAAIEQAWNASDKKLDNARDFLNAKNIPASVLRELVNHKNQEVAVRALYHKNADESVIQEGLKRKASTVSDAARKHPLVASTEIKKGIETGKMKGSSLLLDKVAKESFDKMPEADQKSIIQNLSSRYKDNGSKWTDPTNKPDELKESTADYLKTKLQLINSPHLSEADKKQHVSDIVKAFVDSNPKTEPRNQYSNRDSIQDNHSAADQTSIAFLRLLEKDHPEAKRAVLDHPAMLSSLPEDLVRNIKDPDFLSQIADQMGEHFNRGTQLMNRYGAMENISDSTADKVIKNDDLPLPAFQKLILNSQFKEPSFDLSSHETKHYENLGLDRDPKTVFDIHFGRLPEAERAAKFSEMFAIRGANNTKSEKITNALLASSSVPAQAWDSMWNDANIREKHDFIADNNIANSASPQVKQQALLGVYNNEEDLDKTKAQQDVLKSLSADKPEDKALLNQLIDHQMDDNASNTSKMSDEFVNLIPKKMLAGPDGDQVIRKIATQHPDKVPALAIDAIFQNFFGGQAGSSAIENNEDQIPAAFADLMQKSLYGTETPVGTVPDAATSQQETQEHQAQFFLTLLNHYHEHGYHNTIRPFFTAVAGKQSSDSSRPATSNMLDSLADLPGRAGSGLRHLLVQHNLVSKAKIDALEAVGTDIQNLIPAMSKDRKTELLGKVLSGQTKLDADGMLALIQNVSTGHMGSTAENIGETSKKLIDTVLAQPYDSIDKTRMMNRIFGEVLKPKASRRSRYGSAALNKAETKSLMSNLAAHISAKTDIPEDKKASMLMNMYDAAPEGTAPAAAFKQVINNAVSKNDVATLLELRSRADAPASVNNALGKLAARPETLSTEQTLKMVDMINDNKVNVSTVKRLVAAFESKAITDPNMVDFAEKMEFVKKISQVVTRAPDATEEKPAYCLNVLKKYATDPDDHVRSRANSRLRQVACSQDLLPVKDRVSLYTSLPADIGTDPVDIDLDNEFLNHPAVIQNSLDGWKLDALARSGENLTADNATVLVNRLIAHEDPEGSKLKERALGRLLDNDSADPEDVIKLSRTLPTKTIDGIISDTSLDDKTTSHITESHILYLAKERMNQINHLRDNPQDTGKQPYEPAHVHEMMDGMRRISEALGSTVESETASRMDEKLGMHAEMVGHIADNLDKINQAVQNAKGGSFREADIHNLAVTSLAIANRVMRFGGKYVGQDGVNALNILKTSKAMIDRWAQDKTNPEELSNLIGNHASAAEDWFGKAEGLSVAQWQDALSTDKFMPYHIHNLGLIDNSILDSVDTTKMSEENPGLAAHMIINSFSKMDTDSLVKHGKTMLRNVSSGSTIDADALSSIFPYMKDHLDVKDITNLCNKHPDSSHTIELSAAEHGIGGPFVLARALKDVTADNLARIVRSPSIDKQSANTIMELFKQSPAHHFEAISNALDNQFAPPDLISSISKWLASEKKDLEGTFRRGQYDALVGSIATNPNATFDQVQQIFNDFQQDRNGYFAANQSFNPALSNAKYGGDLLRSIPIEIPSVVPNVEKEKATKSANAEPNETHQKNRSKLAELTSMIPPEGIAWGDFKRQFPKMENVPAVKAMFQSKNNKPVIPEDVATALQKFDDAAQKKAFHLTYSTWHGMQTHTDNHNLVIQLNHSEESEKMTAQDPKLWALCQAAIKMTNQVSDANMGSHPLTPQAVSHVRIDTSSGDKGWIIEEFQSDFAQKFRSRIAKLIEQNPSGLKLGGQSVSVEEILGTPMKDKDGNVRMNPKTQEIMREGGMRAKIDKLVEGWQSASLNASIENAKAHGVKKLYMHGPGVRAMLSWASIPAAKEEARIRASGKTPSSIWYRIKDTYGNFPSKNGFKPCDYTDYPNQNAKTVKEVKGKGLDTNCWVLDLEEPKKA